ncbi:hypothetical protein HJFPF1_12845 [Paramyrothecium foliicola]|nr:hypothetical protein HJFPF1_12845 [Paramyrothecium foliicola]
MGIPFFLLSFLLLDISFAAQRCYYPNGFEARDDYPCDPDAEVSVCCGRGFGSVCLSNKLCGSANDGCCDSGAGRFNVLPPQPDIWATFDTDSTRYVVVGTVFSQERTTSTASETSTSAGSVSSTSSTISTSSVTTQTSDPTNTNDLSEAGVTQDEPGLSTAAIAGIAAGSGVFVILLVAAAYLFWRKRRKANNDNAASQIFTFAKQPRQEFPSQTQQYHNPDEWFPGHGHQPHPQELHVSGDGSQRERIELPAQQHGS